MADPATGVGYEIVRDPEGNPIAVDDGSEHRLQGWGNPGVDLPLFVENLTTGERALLVGIEGVQVGRLSPSGTATMVATDALGSVVLDGGALVGVPEAFGEDAEAGVSGQQRPVYAGLGVLPGLPYQLARARMMDPSVRHETVAARGAQA